MTSPPAAATGSSSFRCLFAGGNFRSFNLLWQNHICSCLSERPVFADSSALNASDGYVSTAQAKPNQNFDLFSLPTSAVLHPSATPLQHPSLRVSPRSSLPRHGRPRDGGQDALPLGRRSHWRRPRRWRPHPVPQLYSGRPPAPLRRRRHHGPGTEGSGYSPHPHRLPTASSLDRLSRDPSSGSDPVTTALLSFLSMALSNREVGLFRGKSEKRLKLREIVGGLRSGREAGLFRGKSEKRNFFSSSSRSSLFLF